MELAGYLQLFIKEALTMLIDKRVYMLTRAVCHVLPSKGCILKRRCQLVRKTNFAWG